METNQGRAEVQEMVGSDALAGVRVCDCSQVMAGPFCTMPLADLGADVIKVESPSGDSTRAMAGPEPGESASYWAVNRNKRGIVVDLRRPEGVEIVRRLAQSADIFVENFRPGVMATLGLDYATLSRNHPELIYASISGFGQTGPYATRRGFDLVTQGMSGIMSVTGDAGLPPMKCGLPVTDLGAGLFITYAILAAYTHRLRTGEGQHLDTSLLEAGIALSVWEASQYWSGGGIPEPLGSAHRMSAPYQAIECADGYITLGAANQRNWERFCHVLNRPDLLARADLATDADRVRHRRELADMIETVTRTKPVQYWLELLDGAGVACGPILNYAQVFADPHVRARGMIQELDHPRGGRIKQLGPAVKFSRTPARLRRPAPTLGQHTAEVLETLGYDRPAIQRLAQGGVVTLGRP